jgi:hypothetical protein
MAYGDYSLDDLEAKFGITNQIVPLFAPNPPVAASDWLKKALEIAHDLPIRTEKAKSEWIVVPILSSLREQNSNFFTIFSGDNLNADKEKGLVGECDFILTKDTHSFSINYPIISIVEAKKNDIEIGVPQCAAQLLGASIINKKKGIQIDKLYGCVTTGKEWLFMCLHENKILIDNQTYFLQDIEKLLGVLQHIIDYYKKVLA